MKHSHEHAHEMHHPHARGHFVTVRHAHEHAHRTEQTGYKATYHRPHTHTSAEEADLRRQQQR